MMGGRDARGQVREGARGARLPAWAGVAAALLLFVVLRWLAGIEPRPLASPKDAGPFVVLQVFKTFALYGQWFLPALILLWTALAVARRQRGVRLFNAVAGHEGGRALARLSWRDFERLTAEYFRRSGFVVDETQGGADGGVDLVLRKGSDRYLVQCKHWRAQRVGVAPVRELYGVMAAARAAGGFFVTSGDYTAEAQRFAAGREIVLIGGRQLADEIARMGRAPGLPGDP